MKYKIIHDTEYTFSSEVFFEPHHLRFKPRNTPHILLESFNLQVEPKPEGISEQLDPENNFIHNCWFEGLHRKLSILTEIEVLVNDFNPFNFIIFPESYTRIPFSYASPWKELLKLSLKAEETGNPLLQYGQTILSASNFNTIGFLTELNRQIHQDFFS